LEGGTAARYRRQRHLSSNPGQADRRADRLWGDEARSIRNGQKYLVLETEARGFPQ
jgi:hypothetical protein